MEKIDSVEMVRKIRDKQNQEIAGMPREDIIKYFREKAGSAQKEAANSVSRKS